MDVEKYLDKIGFDGDPRPDLATLTRLQRCHLLKMPFENLDALNNDEIVLET